MTKQQDRIREVVKVFKPRGWKLIETELDEFDGEADGATRTITCKPIICPYTLYVFLHEVGHVRCGHVRKGCPEAGWREEYEAEMWAFSAMRAAGFPVTTEMVNSARQNILDHIIYFEIESSTEGEYCEIDHEVLRFVFKQKWREYL